MTGTHVSHKQSGMRAHVRDLYNAHTSHKRPHTHARTHTDARTHCMLQRHAWPHRSAAEALARKRHSASPAAPDEAGTPLLDGDGEVGDGADDDTITDAAAGSFMPGGAGSGRNKSGGERAGPPVFAELNVVSHVPPPPGMGTAATVGVAAVVHSRTLGGVRLGPVGGGGGRAMSVVDEVPEGYGEINNSKSATGGTLDDDRPAAVAGSGAPGMATMPEGGGGGGSEPASPAAGAPAALGSPTFGAAVGAAAAAAPGAHSLAAADSFSRRWSEAPGEGSPRQAGAAHGCATAAAFTGVPTASSIRSSGGGIRRWAPVSTARAGGDANVGEALDDFSAYDLNLSSVRPAAAGALGAADGTGVRVGGGGGGSGGGGSGGGAVVARGSGDGVGSSSIKRGLVDAELEAILQSRE
jgi:hypothetical protein